jgi:4-carboxymuconolactone decarboxylase
VSAEAPTPRLAPLPREQWDDDVLSALRLAYPEVVVQRFLSTEPDAKPVPTALTTLVHHPALAGPFLTYNNVLLANPALGHRMRELIVLRVAWRTQSHYEWAQHVMLAPRFDITPADIDAIASDNPAEAWTTAERALVAATDQLIAHHRVDDETWARLAEHLDERQLVEMVFVAGTYACLAMAFNSFGLQLEPGVEQASVQLPDPA